MKSIKSPGLSLYLVMMNKNSSVRCVNWQRMGHSRHINWHVNKKRGRQGDDDVRLSCVLVTTIEKRCCR